ncbi:MAG TPA: ATP-binding cassette domain-containing protein, partial [Polyangiaceae bacterium]|nr:ATP-binding cassette domain-containing protein [Polyangiaceae bacterium]
ALGAPGALGPPGALGAPGAPGAKTAGPPSARAPGERAAASGRPGFQIGDVLLSVRDVSLRLGGHLILDKVSFDVHDYIRETTTGQIEALLGPSGVGKTRLLRIIAGLDAPDAGTVVGPGGAPLTAGSVGVVFQDYPLLRHRTVLSNLLLAGKVGGLAPAAATERAARLLASFGLAERAHFYPAQLSGGQRQRAAIAQQLVVPRRLLLLDEPFSGLDPAALDDVMKLIVEVANLDSLNTIVIITHDIRAAMTVSDTLFVLGRDRDGDKLVPGARIQHTYNMVERGLAWRSDVQDAPEFAPLEREIKAQFRAL